MFSGKFELRGPCREAVSEIDTMWREGEREKSRMVGRWGVRAHFF